MQQVAVLFVRKDSIYKSMPDCDAWDFERDAMKWPGGSPLVAHPPCRGWGEMSHMASPRSGERETAIWSIEQIRKWGGVLEHPKRSKLWKHLNLPPAGKVDEHGGFSIVIDQHWFGHKAKKATILYICGCRPKDLPPIPLSLSYPKYTVTTSGRRKDGTRKNTLELKKHEREATPVLFAEWLVEVARRSRINVSN